MLKKWSFSVIADENPGTAPHPHPPLHTHVHTHMYTLVCARTDIPSNFLELRS